MRFTLSNCVFNLIWLLIVSGLECLPDINKFKKTVRMLNYFSVFISLFQVFTSTTYIRSPKLMYWAQWFAREKEMTSSVMEVLSVTVHIQIFMHECMQVHACIHGTLYACCNTVCRTSAASALRLSSGPNINNVSAALFTRQSWVKWLTWLMCSIKNHK